MEIYNQLFLQALKAALKGEKVQWDEAISHEDWLKLMNLAQMHNVLAMIYEAVYSCPAAKGIDPQLNNTYKKRMVYQVTHQTMKTQEFLALQQFLREEGLTPVVVKGIVCRNLYPKPDYRISADEDVLIPKEQFEACHEKMLAYGMCVVKNEEQIENLHEVSYGKRGNPIYIELHKYLFEPEADAYGEWNQYFTEIFDHVIEEKVEKSTVLTMDHTEHLFYLICHSFKHFLHSGFGIRQVCDITLFANAYGKNIDWQKVLNWCKEIHAEKFGAALFKIGEKYLTFEPERACYPKQWQEIETDETNLLGDLLSGGVYGRANMSRQHSSNMTLNAVAADKKGKKADGNVLSLVFPHVKKLKGRYTYMEKKPYLLPVAWVNRLARYRKETSSMEENRASESVRIGHQRIELLKEYGVISEKNNDK